MRTRTAFTAAFAASIILTTSVVASPASAARPSHDDLPWIAYGTVTDDGSEAVWLIHPDGTGDHRIASGVNDQQLLPDWSPTGRQLVYATRGGDHEPSFIYDLASGRSRQLFPCTDECLGDDEPAYAPDGRTVAVVRALGPFVNDVPSDCGIWIGNVRTHRAKPVTHNALCWREYHPRWSPDGKHLVYWRWNEDDAGNTTGTALFVIDADGSHERRLTRWSDFYGDPDWSPDGKWIVFSSHPLQAFNFVPVVSDLFKLRADGSGRVHRLTGYRSPTFRATKPRYSPDGRSILFTAVTPTSRELWLMPANGGAAKAITTGGIRVLGTLQPRQHQRCRP